MSVDVAVPVIVAVVADAADVAAAAAAAVNVVPVVAYRAVAACIAAELVGVECLYLTVDVCLIHETLRAISFEFLKENEKGCSV